jgi:hypothetical protein
MLSEDPGEVSYSSIGGLNEQIRDLREVQLRLAFAFHALHFIFAVYKSSVRWLTYRAHARYVTDD